MIVGSLLLIVVAVGLLVVGLLQGADALLVASIGASLLAAVALIVGGRQAAAARSSRTAGRVGRQVPSDERYDPFESRLDADGATARETRQPVGAGARGTGGTTYGRGGAPVAGGGATRLGGSGRSDTSPPPVDEPVATAPVRDEPAVAEQPPAPPYEEYPAAAGGDWSADGDDYDDEDPEDEPPIQASSPADIARVSTMTDEVLVIDGRPRYHVRGCVHLLGRESEGLPIGEAVELGFTPCSVCEPNDAVLSGRA